MQDQRHNAEALAASLHRCQNPEPLPPWSIHPRDLGDPSFPLGETVVVVSQKDLEQSDKLIDEAVRHVTRLLHTKPGSKRHQHAQRSARRWLAQFL